VRNRLKLEGAVKNARAFLEVQKEFGSFDAYAWKFVGGDPKRNRPKTMKDVPAQTPESDAMSKDLKKRGFTFVGSTICYAFMQAVGMVDDHVAGCFRVEKADPKRDNHGGTETRRRARNLDREYLPRSHEGTKARRHEGTKARRHEGTQRG